MFYPVCYFGVKGLSYRTLWNYFPGTLRSLPKKSFFLKKNNSLLLKFKLIVKIVIPIKIRLLLTYCGNSL